MAPHNLLQKRIVFKKKWFVKAGEKGN